MAERGEREQLGEQHALLVEEVHQHVEAEGAERAEHERHEEQEEMRSWGVKF